MTVYAPTTDVTRIVLTLFTILQDAFDAALVGMTKIVSLAARSSNVHQGLEKIITRAGLVPWTTSRKPCDVPQKPISENGILNTP